jgi:hypothetical protein
MIPVAFLPSFFLMLVVTAGIEAEAYLTLDTTYGNYIAIHIYIYICVYGYTTLSL